MGEYWWLACEKIWQAAKILTNHTAMCNNAHTVENFDGEIINKSLKLCQIHHYFPSKFCTEQ